MKGKYSKHILEYCEKEDVLVPPGFLRHSASHLAVIRLDGEKPKLVAKTFFKREDLMYYISSNLVGLVQDSDGNLPATIIDFKENKNYKVSESGSLV